jgi:translation elongation factor EF-1beta
LIRVNKFKINFLVDDKKTAVETLQNNLKEVSEVKSKEGIESKKSEDQMVIESNKVEDN